MLYWNLQFYFLAVTNQSLKATQAVIRHSRSKHREVWPGTGEPPGAQCSKLTVCYGQSRVLLLWSGYIVLSRKQRLVSSLSCNLYFSYSFTCAINKHWVPGLAPDRSGRLSAPALTLWNSLALNFHSAPSLHTLGRLFTDRS